MEKEVKIVPPVGYMVDKEKSTFECIKFKPIEIERWRDSNPHIKGWYLHNNDVIGNNRVEVLWKAGNLDTFATEKQAMSAFAMAQISQIMANDERFGGVVTNEEWKGDTLKYVLVRKSEEIFSETRLGTYTFLAFHTEEQRDLFLEENEDLVKQYLMID